MLSRLGQPHCLLSQTAEIHPSSHLSIHTKEIHPAIYLTITHLPIHPYICPSIHSSIYSSSSHPSIQSYIHLFIQITVSLIALPKHLSWGWVLSFPPGGACYDLCNRQGGRGRMRSWEMQYQLRNLLSLFTFLTPSLPVCKMGIISTGYCEFKASEYVTCFGNRKVLHEFLSPSSLSLLVQHVP